MEVVLKQERGFLRHDGRRLAAGGGRNPARFAGSPGQLEQRQLTRMQSEPRCGVRVGWERLHARGRDARGGGAISCTWAGAQDAARRATKAKRRENLLEAAVEQCAGDGGQLSAVRTEHGGQARRRGGIGRRARL